MRQPEEAVQVTDKSSGGEDCRSPRRVHRWLCELHELVAGRSHESEALQRIDLYASHVVRRFPPAAFTRSSLEEVASRCRYWPRYGELCEHLGAWWRENRPFLIALPAPVPPAANDPEPTAEERERVRAIREELLAALHARAPTGPASPSRDVTLQGDALLASRARRFVP